MTNQKKVKEESNKNNTVRLEIETTEKVYALLKILAKRDRRSIKNYLPTALYQKMAGDIDYLYAKDKRTQGRYYKTLREVYSEA